MSRMFQNAQIRVRDKPRKEDWESMKHRPLGITDSSVLIIAMQQTKHQR